MTTLLLIRHGENDYVKKHRLPGRLPGIHLNARGRQQAEALTAALKEAPITALYASPLERAVETAQPLAQVRGLEIRTVAALTDTDVGIWQGRSWKVLRRTKTWQVIQKAPSRFRFPEGESFIEAQARIVSALEEILARHKKDTLVVVVFHADPIKLAVAHYLGLPLDQFQRLGCDPASITRLDFHEQSCRLTRLNCNPLNREAEAD
ncbi:MAG: histidine phosphatase family protein [Anaerolineales bacterium]|nr:histidine phosphatase family protein [Anaerolineales bacterium]